MNVADAVARRRSIRAFLDEPVDRALLERVLEQARFAPSGGNVQPWQASVLTGAPLAALIEKVAERRAAGVEEPEYPIYPPNLPEPWRGRRFGVGEDLYAALGIAREDRPGRLRQFARNFRAFDAPVLLLCHTPRFMGPPQWSDMGMWLQTVMLLLEAEGVQSCAQEAWSVMGATVHAHLGLDDDMILFCGLAIGHADGQAPENRFERTRAPLSETVRFDGF